MVSPLSQTDQRGLFAQPVDAVLPLGNELKSAGSFLVFSFWRYELKLAFDGRR
jgi:hypothetical protein